MPSLKTRLDVTRQLAEFSCALTLDRIPPEVLDRARMFVLDGIGIILGAVEFERSERDSRLTRYIDAVAPPGSATVIGERRTTSPMMAAFINGTRSEVLDCQDTNIECRIHNGSAVISAALAAGEAATSSGADLLASIVAGYEVGCRLAVATQPSHWYSGFQITGTYNTCAAAATAGRLMHFDYKTMAAALGISGYIIPISNGDNVFKGHSIKPIHGGQPAMCGLSAAHLAAAGYEASPLEGEPPRYHSPLHILGKKDPDLAAAVRGFGERWHSLEVGFKPYPVGLFNIGPVEACLDLLAKQPIKASEIEAIKLTTYHDAWKFTGCKYTTVDSNYVDAHLSMPFSIAVTLTDGAMTPKQLSAKRLRDPIVHELASRVNVVEDEAYNRNYPQEWPLLLEVQLVGGKVLSRKLDNVKWSPRRPPLWNEMCAKFRAMSDPVIGATRAQEVVDFVSDIEKAPSILRLLKLLTPA